jgi:hypothetical protein
MLAGGFETKPLIFEDNAGFEFRRKSNEKSKMLC